MNPTTSGRTALAVCLTAAWAAAAAQAAAPDAASRAHDEGIEEILVTAHRIGLDETIATAGPAMAVDTARLLRGVPGADVNTNGRLSGIAQFRGLYGDRVAVSLDGICPIGGGPNAMDAPLSYASPMITEALHVDRGIPGVAAVAEGPGGHIDARIDRGAFAESPAFTPDGWIASRYEDNGNTRTSAARLTVANASHRFSVVSELDRADDIDTPAGTIRPSALNRDRHDVSYAWRGEATEVAAFAGRLDTTETGTPSLPMDIRYIDTDLYGLSASRRIGIVTLEAEAGYNDVDHLMDNYSLRAAPPPPRQRRNHTTGRGTSFALGARLPIAGAELAVGVDGRLATHDAVITNPNNAAFRIDNFVDVERDLLGLYAEWRTATGAGEWEFGVRYNTVSTDAGEVSASGMMGMMAAAAGDLADRFNAADRGLDFGNVDVVAGYRRSLSPDLAAVVEAGSRTRAPSYQELYLWLPLQATGGLADGRTYIGNLDLDAERSNEINAGLDWTAGSFSLSPRVYYRRVDDYIQGVPAADMTAGMIASMMSGAPALQFDNVDAELYGFDMAWRYGITENLAVDGVASLVRGERRDTDDYLYRLTPDNVTVGLDYRRQRYTLRGEVVAYRRQDRVAAYNGETETAGYALVNLEFAWSPLPSLTLEAAVENLLDREYRDHLTGLNRAGGSDIPVAERLPGAGRSFAAGLTYRF
jgi:iron complex outermembrane receptor protein